MRCSSRAQNLQHRIVLACGITSSGVIESERTVVSINSSGSLLPTRIVVPQIPRQGWDSGVAPPPTGSSGKLNAGGCSVFFFLVLVLAKATSHVCGHPANGEMQIQPLRTTVPCFFLGKGTTQSPQMPLRWLKSATVVLMSCMFAFVCVYV